jgi:hypothetical protein
MFAAATAVWFGLVAGNSGRNWLAWVFAGALFGLTTTTLVLGLYHAALIPISHEAVRRSQIEALWTCVMIIGLPGLCFTFGLLRSPWPSGASR